MRKGIVTALLLGFGGCMAPMHQMSESEEHRAACEAVCYEAGADAYSYNETRQYRICQCFRVGPNQTTPGRGIDI